MSRFCLIMLLRFSRDQTAVISEQLKPKESEFKMDCCDEGAVY